MPRQRPYPNVREVEPGHVITGKDWTVAVGLAHHFQPYLECYGYRVETAEGSVCYSGDNGLAGTGIIELAKNADLFIHMMCLETPSAENEDSCPLERPNVTTARPIFRLTGEDPISVSDMLS